MAIAKQPVFIGGLYRSGTSLLRAMLGKHPNIFGGLETFWFDLIYDVNDKLDNIERNWDATRKEPIDSHVTRLAEFYELDYSMVLSMAHSCSCGEEFLDEFMHLCASKRGKERWVEKTPANVLHVDRIFAYWPDAVFLHMVRDPRDVYASMKEAGKWADPRQFAELWMHFIGTFDLMRGKHADKIHEVHYEYLVKDATVVTSKLLTIIKEPWDIAVAMFDGQKDEFEKVYKYTGKASTTLKRLRQPICSNRISIWREHAGLKEDLKVVEKIISDNGYQDRWDYCKYNLQ